MATEDLQSWLDALGIQSLCEWDVVAFLYRHPTSLLGADYIARLLGYPDESVLGALDALEPLGLVERSRVSQNVRLYQFTVPTDPPRRHALERLQALTDGRAGRPLLSKQLRRGERSPQDGLKLIRRFPDETPPVDEGSKTWLKAI